MKKYFLHVLLVISIITSTSQAEKRPKNIIFMIGDGMGIAHVYAGMVANGNKLNIERCTYAGFSKTYSSNNFTTDSGAGGTALACGVKTKNGMIGMTPDSLAVQSFLELADSKGLSTGLVVACAVTHATPASYIAHNINRNNYEEIATDFLKTDIDVFIGGGRNHFEKRLDGRNLTDELIVKDYQIAYSIDDVKSITTGKIAGLLYDIQNPGVQERGKMLPEATVAALNILDNNKKGFFLMVEGSQIDWAAHDNNSNQVALEMIDFDETVGHVLDFAQKDGNTLVIITADHETGGLTIPTGNISKSEFNGLFSTKNHSGVPVPVFAYGPGAEKFSGIMENTSFKAKMEKLLKFSK